MKKTVLALCLLLCFCALLFCSCEKNPDETTDKGSVTTAPETGGDKPSDCEHTFGEWTTVKAASCKEAGLAERSCSQCAATEEKTLAKSEEHVVVLDKAVEPTCAAEGLTEGSHCSVCEKVLSKQKSVPKLDHTYEARLCTGCGAWGDSEGLEFTAVTGGYALTGLGSCRDDILVVPSTYNGKPVIEIHQSAISYPGHRIREIHFPDSVKEIRYHAVDMAFFAVIYLGKNSAPVQQAFYLSGGCEIVNRSSKTVSSAVFATQSEGAPYYIHKSEESKLDYTEEGLGFLTYGGKVYLCDYKGQSEVLTLPEQYNNKTYAITSYCFRKCDTISKVILGKGVTAIGYCAFAESSLTEIDLSGKVTSLPGNCFRDCKGLTEIVIPDNVKTISTQCFEGTGLLTVTIGKSVTDVGHSTFRDCPVDTLYFNARSCTEFQDTYGNFKKVVIGKDVEVIPGEFMRKNTELVSLTFEEGSRCRIIDSGAFAETSISSVTIPSSVTKIQGGFSKCEKLTQVYYNAINCTDCRSGFSSCGGGNGVDFVVGKEVTRLPAELILGTRINSFTFEEGSQCAYIESGFISAPLANVTLPASVIDFDRNDFDIASLKVSPDNPHYETVNACLVRKSDNALVAVYGSEYTIPDSVRVILKDAFHDSGVTHIMIPDTVEKLEDGCLSCATARSVSLPFVGYDRETPAEILRLFGNEKRNGFEKVTLYDALHNNRGEFYIPADFTTLTVRGGTLVFQSLNCLHALRVLKLTSDVSSIADKAFMQCTAVEAIYYGGSDAEWEALCESGFMKYISDSVTVETNAAI